MMRVFFVPISLAIAMVGCTGEKDTGVVEEYNQGPEVTLIIPDGRFVDGDNINIAASIVDVDGVSGATLYYRKMGDAYWESTEMTGADSDWTALVVGQAPGVEVYCKAEDAADPAIASLSPVGGPSNPLQIPVLPKSRELPFREGFELLDTQFSLRDLDWWTPSDGRNTFAWILNTSQMYEGSYSVQHMRGAEGMDEMGDWLISPPLNFSTETSIMVSWQELGLHTEAMQEHSLWVSTGSRLPEDGDFQLVGVLDAPVEGGWHKHSNIDLSQFAGEPLVYVAWKWTGSNADDWFIDAVEVRRMAPELEVQLLTTNLTHPGEALAPGDGVTVSLIVENQTNAEGTDCVATLQIPEGMMETESSITNWGVAGGEAIVLDSAWTVSMDTNPHRRLPVQVDLSCVSGDTTETWQFTDDILVGHPSLAHIEFAVTARSQIYMGLGVGDPEAPTWSSALVSGVYDVGVYQIELDITDQYAYLPASAGEHRWFLQSDTSSDVNIQGLQISYGDTVVSGDVPRLSLADFTTTLYIPEPPSWYVYVQSPSSVQPGSVDISMNVSVYNLGNPTQGMVTAYLESNHPNAIVNSTPMVVDTNTWNSNETHTLTGFLSVAETHTSSLPVDLVVILQDEMESWMEPFEIDVPFPRLGITNVHILDDDGILSANESSDLDIEIANTGGANATGVVSANLSLLSSSTASAVITNNNPSFGFVNAGDIRHENDFHVAVSSGVDGDILDFQLTMTDAVRTYQDSFQLVLGQAPWISVSSLPDDIGDNLDANAIDIESVEYRVVNGIVEMRVTSANVINPSTAFIEAWGTSGGAGYAYFRWVLQSGVATMQGYNSGFQRIGTMTASFPDDHHILLSFDSADMDLALDQFKIGFAAGWCGPPEYYCDQYPNNWGYPYVSFSTGRWFDVSW